MVVAPVKLLLPPRVTVSVPVFVKLPTPVIAVLNVSGPFSLKVSVPLSTTPALLRIVPLATVVPLPSWKVAPLPIVVRPL